MTQTMQKGQNCSHGIVHVTPKSWKKNESPTQSYFTFMLSHWHKEEIILLDFLLLYTLRYFQVLTLSTTFLLKPEEDAVKPTVYNGHPREIAR